MGAPLEYLNPAFYEPLMREEGLPNLAEYWAHVRLRRTSANGVFGWKMFTPSYMRIAEDAPQLLAQIAPDYVIYLTRRDKIEQAVSYAMAMASGVWYSGVLRAAHPAYSIEAVTRALKMIEHQEESWQRIFACTECQYLPVYYEDVIADWKQVVREIAAFCGVALGAELDALPHVPLPDKQADQTNQAWVQAYRRDIGGPTAESAETEEMQM